jgi:hypothetical protein
MSIAPRKARLQKTINHSELDHIVIGKPKMRFILTSDKTKHEKAMPAGKAKNPIKVKNPTSANSFSATKSIHIFVTASPTHSSVRIVKN